MLRIHPDEILNQDCEPVEDPGDHRELIETMVEVLYEHNGIGLAAPQVGELLEIFLLRLDPEERLHEVYMNPDILETGPAARVNEGCLSFPDVQVEIERPEWVRFQALTPAGETVERRMEGMMAQCVVHEVDHLRGVTLVEHCDLQQKIKINQAMKQRTEESTRD